MGLEGVWKLPENEKRVSEEQGDVLDSHKDIESLPDIDYAAERKLVRKLDLMIVPPVMLLYLFSFLDRVGNARCQTLLSLTKA